MLTRIHLSQAIAKHAARTAQFVSQAPWRHRLLGGHGASEEELAGYVGEIVAFLETDSGVGDWRQKIKMGQVPKEFQQFMPLSNPLADVAESEMARLEAETRQMSLKNAYPAPSNVEVPENSVDLAPLPGTGGANGDRASAAGSRPAAPAAPAQPLGGVKTPMDTLSGGIEKVMMVLGQEGFGPLEQRTRSLMAMALGSQPGTYGYNSYSAGILQRRHEQGEVTPETNLCYALLETWMRSCSAPQLFFLQTDTIVSHFVDKAAKATRSATNARFEAEMRRNDCPSTAALPTGTGDDGGAGGDDDGWGSEVKGQGVPQVCLALASALEQNVTSQERDTRAALDGLHAVSFLAHQVMLRVGDTPGSQALADLDSVDPEFQDLMKDVDELNGDAMPDADGAPSEGANDKPFWQAWDGKGAREMDPDNVAEEETEAVRLKQEGQKHIEEDKLIATLLQHGLDMNGNKVGPNSFPLRGSTVVIGGKGTTPSAPLAPAAPLPPFFGALGSMFDGVSSAVGGVLKVSSAAAKLTGALDRATGGNGVRQIVGLVLGLFAAFMNVGVARGQRPGFAAPEAYDPHGPYGPEPFPFQTPGAEKCHRYLTTYLAKCQG